MSKKERNPYANYHVTYMAIVCKKLKGAKTEDVAEVKITTLMPKTWGFRVRHKVRVYDKQNNRIYGLDLKLPRTIMGLDLVCEIFKQLTTQTSKKAGPHETKVNPGDNPGLSE